MSKYYQPEIETASVEQIKAIQSEKLVKQVKHVYENVEYYRNLMDEKGVTPDDIKSIEKLERTIVESLRSALGIGAKVHLVNPQSIVRSEGKAKRVIDLRKGKI